jgi:hypothetical protein
MTDKEKAAAKVRHLRLKVSPPCKRWRNTGYFDVPGAVMRELAAEGVCETRKRDGAAPQEYR